MSRAPSASPPGNKRAYQTIYPQYLDANLLPREGRRLTATQAVANPSVEEILTALRDLGFSAAFVDLSKSLPCAQSQAKQVPAPRGCVKVAIKAPKEEHYIKKSEFDVETRLAIKEGFPNKMEVMRRVAEKIKAKNAVRPKAVDMTPANQPKESGKPTAALTGKDRRR